MIHFLKGALFAGLILLTGCRATQPAVQLGLAESPVSFTPMTDSLEADPEVEALVAPYRERLQSRIDEVIGEATAQLVKGDPESALGNFAADAILEVVNQRVDTPVDMAVTNNGGLRTPVSAGPISVGRMFELMPFENMVVILELTVAQVDSLAQQIARVNGEPIAGFSFVIDAQTRRAKNIRVADQPLNPDRTYRLATSDYLANGGGNMPALWSPTSKEALNLLLRDTFIEYVRQQRVIEPMLDGRLYVQ